MSFAAIRSPTRICGSEATRPSRRSFSATIPLATSKAEQEGTFPIDFGKAWIKSPKLTAGQAPIMRYNRDLMMAILWDRMPYLSAMVNTEIIPLEQASQAYEMFSEGSPKKFVIDPHGVVEKAA